MSRPPSRPGQPSPYPRSDSQRPYPGPLPEHYTPQSYSHPPPRHPYPQGNPPPVNHSNDRDPYIRAPHPADAYYYPPPHNPYIPPSHNHPDYRAAHHHLPPPPHPPAPPAPPRPQQFREVYSRPTRDSPAPRPNLVPTFNYYRQQAEYEGQHGLPRQHHLASDRGKQPTSNRGRSRSTGSGYGSGVAGEGDQDQEATPSPVDPGRIQRWEEQHSQGPEPSRHASSGSGSYRDDEDGNEEDITIDPSLTNAPRNYYSPASYPNDLQDSPIDDGSFDEQGELEDSGLEMPNSQKRPNSVYYPSTHHQAQFAALAKQTGPVNTQRGHIGLNSLVDGEPGERPAYPIPTIIKCAILGSPHQQLTLSELYAAMEARFSYYRDSDKKSWRNSVRHNLSLNNQFDKKARPITEPGKGHYWVVVPDMPQGNKRERKRNKKPGKRALAQMALEAERAAAQQSNNTEEQDARPSASTSTAPSLPIDPQLAVTTAVQSAAIRPHTVGTLPANAGSYAAVTGALPTPAPIDRQLFRAWNGNQTATAPATATLGSALQASQHDRHTATNAQPQFGKSSLHPAAFTSSNSPVRHVAGPGSAESSRSGGGPQRSSTARGLRRYDPTAPPSPNSTPPNAFAALAAQIEREGTGATGSGGPALRGKQNKGKRLTTSMDEDEDSDDDDPSDDEEYLPSRGRRR